MVGLMLLLASPRTKRPLLVPLPKVTAEVEAMLPPVASCSAPLRTLSAEPIPVSLPAKTSVPAVTVVDPLYELVPDRVSVPTP